MMENMKERNDVRINKMEIDVANMGHITNTYIVQDVKTNNAVLIDPAFDGGAIIKYLDVLNLKLVACIITHSHADHFGALKDVLNIMESRNKQTVVYVHELGLEGLNDKMINEQESVGLKLEAFDFERIVGVKEGEQINIDNIRFEVIHTPGHTLGGIVLYEKNSDTLFSGDTIFKNTYGRTDLNEGSSKDMKASLDKIFYRFDDIDVFPGHGEIFKLDESKRKIKLIYAFKG